MLSAPFYDRNSIAPITITAERDRNLRAAPRPHRSRHRRRCPLHAVGQMGAALPRLTVPRADRRYCLAPPLVIRPPAPARCPSRPSAALPEDYAVSMRDAPAKASFELKGIPEKAVAEIIGGDRKIEVRGGKFQDDFQGYEVRLYRLAGLVAARGPKAPGDREECPDAHVDTAGWQTVKEEAFSFAVQNPVASELASSAAASSSPPIDGRRKSTDSSSRTESSSPTHAGSG